MLVFTGVREVPFFQTGQRNIESLRRRMPAPSLYLHTSDAEREGLVDGDWAKLSTPQGEVVAQVAVHETMKQGIFACPWMVVPRTAWGGLSSWRLYSSDAVLAQTRMSGSIMSKASAL